MTRIWRYPDLRNGATFHHITDTHFGAAGGAAWVNGWLEDIRKDVNFLRIAQNRGHLHTGDMIHWYDQALNDNATRVREETAYKTWRDSIRGDGLPFAEAVGNHDLIGPMDANRERTLPRLGSAWASAMGLSSVNNVYDMGEIKIITVGPDTWAAGAPFVLSGATNQWLNNQLQSAGKPCFVACHVPFDEQYTTNSNETSGLASLEPGNPGLMAMIDANPNCVGWLSGHRHADISTQTRHATSFSTGSRKIFAINGPSCGGGRKGNSITEAEAPWEAWNYSMYITYLGDAIDVRWRDHNTQSWTGPPNQTVRHITL